jgi:hypothetical protein
MMKIAAAQHAIHPTPKFDWTDVARGCPATSLIIENNHWDRE